MAQNHPRGLTEGPRPSGQRKSRRAIAQEGRGAAPSARLESKETDRKRFAIRLNVHAVNRVQPRSRTRGK